MGCWIFLEHLLVLCTCFLCSDPLRDVTKPPCIFWPSSNAEDPVMLQSEQRGVLLKAVNKAVNILFSAVLGLSVVQDKKQHKSKCVKYVKLMPYAIICIR